MHLQPRTLKSQPSLSSSQIADLRLAASQMSGAKRRAFEAEMTLKYCEGNPLVAEAVFGWGRQTVAVGLAQYHGRGSQSPGFSLTQGGQGEATEEDQRDGRHL